MGAPKVTDALITRTIKAAQIAGIPIGAITVNNVEGTVRIETAQPESVDEQKTNVRTLAPKKWGKGRLT
ncbi:hypothetical protein KL867_17590 [Ruegeria litorea]|uniref:Uncharacterized protein n=1 Tax=Falsiruegeria litorea TaxID=1280831 RepID=A0ABS5WYI4_9RHOB|nr:hypothetical protein [Falsiruegeria litorea]MBT3142885.1 hypothetical protein [Falsiruegeria litorea]